MVFQSVKEEGILPFEETKIDFDLMGEEFNIVANYERGRELLKLLDLEKKDS